MPLWWLKGQLPGMVCPDGPWPSHRSTAQRVADQERLHALLPGRSREVGEMALSPASGSLPEDPTVTGPEAVHALMLMGVYLGMGLPAADGRCGKGPSRPRPLMRHCRRSRAGRPWGAPSRPSGTAGSGTAGPSTAGSRSSRGRWRGSRRRATGGRGSEARDAHQHGLVVCISGWPRAERGRRRATRRALVSRCGSERSAFRPRRGCRPPNRDTAPVFCSAGDDPRRTSLPGHAACGVRMLRAASSVVGERGLRRVEHPRLLGLG